MSGPSFGILHDFRNPWPHEQPYAAYYAQCLEEVAEADRLGFDMVWMSEHHLTHDGLLPSPLTMGAAVAARTRRIGIGTNILVLPLHHPLRVCEDAAVVDLLSGGRLTLGVAQGYAEAEFAAFGVDIRHRPSLLEEGVAALRQGLTYGRVSMQGKRWSFDDIPVTPSPRRAVPIHVGAVTPPALRRAVRIGDGVIVYCGIPRHFRERRHALDGVLAEQAASDAEATGVTEAAEGVPHRSHPSVRLTCTGVMHVAEDPERAWREAAPGIAYLEGSMAAYDARVRAPDSWQAPRFERGEYLVGTPEQVAARLVELHQEIGYDHFAHWARLPGLPHATAMESLRLVASQVLPEVRRTVAP